MHVVIHFKSSTSLNHNIVAYLFSGPERSHAHTSADAHGGNEQLLVLALGLGETSGKLASTSGAEGVAKGNSSTDGVDLLDGDANVLDGHEGLGSKGLVDLVEVDVVLCDANLLEEGGDSKGGSDTHDLGWDTDDGGGNVLAEDGEAELVGYGTADEENGGSSVGHLRGVTGVGCAVLGEGGLELGKLLLGGDADSVVVVDNDLLLLLGLGVNVLDLDGDDFGDKLASLLGGSSLLVRVGGKLVLSLTGDVVLLGNVLGCDAHGNEAVCSLRVGNNVLRDGRGHATGTVVLSHGLDTSSDSDIVVTGLDGVGDVNGGLETGRALAVEGVHRNALRQF